jgi:hypothetical protein
MDFGFQEGFFKARFQELGSVFKPGMDFTGSDRFFRIGAEFYRIRFGFSGRSRIQDSSGFRNLVFLRMGLVRPQAVPRFFLSGSD